MADYSIEVAIPNQGPKGDNGGIPEAPEDAVPYARKDGAWTPTVELNEDGSVPAIVQVRQGTNAQLAEIVLNSGEIAVELENSVPKQIRVGDGTTAGGVAPFGWTVVTGTSDDDQIITNSTSFVDVDFFKDLAALQLNAFYQFFGTAKFFVEGAGGVKVNCASFANQGALVLLGGSSDWPNAPSVVPGGNVTISDAEDFGYIQFQGFFTPGSLFFSVGFAQQSASAAGTASFLGQGSSFGYRRIK